MKVTGLDHLVLTVSDIAATVAFYQDILGMEPQVVKAADGSTRTSLGFGTQKINLHAAKNTFKPHAHTPTAGSADLCLLVDSPLDEWVNHLKSHKVDIINGPVSRSGARGQISSIYLRDPDLNLIEVSIYV
ncbi:MAG TPA: VOC family virulence protein [Rhodobacteraceae bacterium]|nr:VOC family virulence protein [Paracoccaceae bacterium]|tara:strand:- start:3202 stop:3594 length:393 start_codon:yes stop_codon:yes gene_type:complete